jgi:hypothetical protein
MPPDTSFWNMQFKDVLTLLILVATVFAIVWGPIKAVQITRANDENRETRRRKYDVFHSLMKTRRFALAAEHVMALNLVQVEFYQHPKIDAAYRAYIALLSQKGPPPDDKNFEHFWEVREDALYDLLHEIGHELGYEYDKRDLKKLAYGPQGWQDDEQQLRASRALLIELLTGKRAIPVIEFEKLVAAMGKYPPPPDKTVNGV